MVYESHLDLRNKGNKRGEREPGLTAFLASPSSQARGLIHPSGFSISSRALNILLDHDTMVELCSQRK